ncbi:MAG TPA: hypothetical protein VGH08_11725 [Chthoniobacterales bacterium]
MHFDQNILFVIIVAVVGIFRLISRVTGNAPDQSQRNKPRSSPSLSRESPPLAPRSRPKSDEERVRELLEALGQPAGTTPPPKVMPRTNVAPRPLAPVQPPAMRPFSPVIVPIPDQPQKKIAAPRERKRSPVERKSPVLLPPAVAMPTEANEPGSWIRAAELAQAPAYEIQTAGEAEVSWKNVLRSSNSIRSAIILREILGPPRALRPLESAITQA